MPTHLQQRRLYPGNDPENGPATMHVWNATSQRWESASEPWHVPFNLALHAHMTELGYRREYFEADFDDGDAENGPGVGGHPAFDQYTGPDEYVYVSEFGEMGRESRNLEFETWLETEYEKTYNQAN